MGGSQTIFKQFHGLIKICEEQTLQQNIEHFNNRAYAEHIYLTGVIKTQY